MLAIVTIWCIVTGNRDGREEGIKRASRQGIRDAEKARGSDLVSGIFNEALQNSIESDFANLIASEISSEILNIAA